MHIEHFTPKQQIIHSFQLYRNTLWDEYMVCQITSLSKLKNTEILSASFLTKMPWDWKSTTRKKMAKNTNTWRLNNMILNTQCVSEESKEEIQKCLETNESQTKWFKCMGCIKSSSKSAFIAMQAYLTKQENLR